MTPMAIPPVLAGDFLRKAREHAALTQTQLARILGLDSKTVRDAEKAARPIKPERIFAWALATGVDPTWLQWNVDACGQADMAFDFRVPVTAGGALRACRDSNPKPSDLYVARALDFHKLRRHLFVVTQLVSGEGDRRSVGALHSGNAVSLARGCVRLTLVSTDRRNVARVKSPSPTTGGLAVRESQSLPSDSYASPGLRLVGRCRCCPGVHRQGGPDTRWVLAA